MTLLIEIIRIPLNMENRSYEWHNVIILILYLESSPYDNGRNRSYEWHNVIILILYLESSPYDNGSGYTQKRLENNAFVLLITKYYLMKKPRYMHLVKLICGRYLIIFVPT